MSIGDILDEDADDRIAICSFRHEGVRFASLAKVSVQSAEGDETVRRRFCERFEG